MNSVISPWWLVWMTFMLLCLVPSIGYGWGYRGWGPLPEISPETPRTAGSHRLDIEATEFVAITGASGSGKSTTMSILGCLDVPSAGEYRIEGVAVPELSGDVLAAHRNTRFGFVFQQFNLLTRTSALDNVAMPLVYAGIGSSERLRRAREALNTVGLSGREHARTNELSGGQQQHVAVARAIVNDP